MLTVRVPTTGGESGAGASAIVDDDFGCRVWPSALVVKADAPLVTPPARGEQQAARSEQCYFATKPASVISCVFSLSSSSRNFSMSGPVRKIGLSACFSR